MKNRLFAVTLLITLLLAGFPFPASADACDPVYHVVKPGQNLTQIARYYGVTVTAIVKANNLWNPNFIYPGQRLLIPLPCKQPPTSGCTTIHVVKRGEYLKIIAARYRVTVSAIVQANNIKNPNLIYPGQRLKIPIPCPTPRGPWKGQYWNNRDLSGNPKFTRYSNAVNSNWGKGAPKGLSNDNFSIRWTRTKKFEAGRYLFDVKVDDGVRLLVDGELLIDKWHDSAPTHYTVEKELTAGDHKLQLDYYEHTGGAQVKLTIERLSQPPASGPWKGVYFNNMALQAPAVWTTTHKNIDFDWGNKSPKAGISADFFSARWTGEFSFAGGKYRFYATVDDGIRIYLDDQLILDKWHDTSRRTYSVDVDLSAGAHRVKVEYYEHTGTAVAKVWWTKQ